MMSFRATPSDARGSRGIRTLAVLATLLAFAPANAQSTTNVGHYERPIQADLSLGTDFAESQNVYCCNSGPFRMLSAGVRWRPVDDGGFRLGFLTASRNTEVTYYTANNQEDRAQVRERIIAATLSADYFLRVIGDLGASVSVGVGVAPRVQGRLDRSAQNTYPVPYNTTEAGMLYTGSVGLRYRWIFVEQHLIILSGANSAIRENREFFPVSVGVRF